MEAPKARELRTPRHARLVRADVVHHALPLLHHARMYQGAQVDAKGSNVQGQTRGYTIQVSSIIVL